MKKFQKTLLLQLAVLLMFFIVRSPIRGQSYQTFMSELNEIIEKSKWRIGPIRAYPAIQFTNVGYDGNVYYQKERDDQTSDYTATISPQFRFHLLFRRFLIISLTENPEYVYYFKEKRERRWNNTLTPAFKLLLFHRFVVSGNYSYMNRRRRVTSEFDVRAQEIVKGYYGSFFYESARRTSFGISASIRKFRYEDITFPEQEVELSRALNREERTGNFEFFYQIFSESYFFLRGGYTEYTFEHPNSKWRNSYSHQVYGGIIFPILGRMRGTLSLGYKRLLAQVETKRGFSGMVGNTGLDIRIRRFGFRLQYSRDCRFSYYTNNFFFLENRYGAGISFYVSRFLRLDYNFLYGMNNYPEPAIIRLPDENYMEMVRKDRNRFHTAGIVIRIIRSTGVGLMLNYWERESNIPEVDRNRMFIGGYLTYEF